MQKDNPLEFKTKDPEIEELQRQSQIFLDLCLEIEKKFQKFIINKKVENEKRY